MSWDTIIENDNVKFPFVETKKQNPSTRGRVGLPEAPNGPLSLDLFGRAKGRPEVGSTQLRVNVC